MDDSKKPLDESVTIPTSACDYLINHGLGDKNHITYYRLAMQNPKAAIQNPQYRAYVGEILEKLMRIIWSDNFMQNRLRTLLLQNYHGMVEDEEVNVTMSQIRSLIKKV